MADEPADLMCPSSHPDIQGAEVLGVVQAGPNGPEVAYINAHVPVTTELLALAAPANPGEVFRLAGRCQTKSCPHFDGRDCGLATRIVQTMSPVVDALPPCLFRRECRWFAQEGAAACYRCPQVMTVNTRPSLELTQIVFGR